MRSQNQIYHFEKSPTSELEQSRDEVLKLAFSLPSPSSLLNLPIEGILLKIAASGKSSRSSLSARLHTSNDDEDDIMMMMMMVMMMMMMIMAGC